MDNRLRRPNWTEQWARFPRKRTKIYQLLHNDYRESSSILCIYVLRKGRKGPLLPGLSVNSLAAPSSWTT